MCGRVWAVLAPVAEDGAHRCASWHPYPPGAPVLEQAYSGGDRVSRPLRVGVPLVPAAATAAGVPMVPAARTAAGVPTVPAARTAAGVPTVPAGAMLMFQENCRMEKFQKSNDGPELRSRTIIIL